MYTYIIADSNFFSYLTGGTSFNNLNTATSTGIILGTTNDTDFLINSGGTYVVTGHSSSRLVELRKYVTGGTIAQIYVTGGTVSNDGIDLAQSVGNQIVYYIGAPIGIRYVDILTGDTSGTTFSFTTSGVTNNPNFINAPIYKDMNKENIISNPKINDDVFIVRQEISAFDGNYRLEYIQRLADLTTYAGGNFFNIINNT